LNRGGVFLGEYWAETPGDPRRETAVRGVRRLERGEPKTDAGGEDICMAFTEEGDLKAGRGVPRTVGMKSSSSYWEKPETPDIREDLAIDRRVTFLPTL
jgi:hypothetical protein